MDFCPSCHRPLTYIGVGFMCESCKEIRARGSYEARGNLLVVGSTTIDWRMAMQMRRLPSKRGHTAP